MLGKIPRDPKSVGSFAELRKYYSELWKQLDECKRMQSASASVAKELVTFTKREHAKAKERSAAYYASSAATALIIGYQIVEVAGGWGKWAPVAEHEATIGVLQVALGSLFAWALRPLQ
jgi:hypothetical protein